MKRIVYTKRGGLEAIEIIDQKSPEPGNNEVMIEVHRAGINFADLMMRQGLYGAAPDFPFTPGYEVSGVIRASDQMLNGTMLGTESSLSLDSADMQNKWWFQKSELGHCRTTFR